MKASEEHFGCTLSQTESASGSAISSCTVVEVVAAGDDDDTGGSTDLAEKTATFCCSATVTVEDDQPSHFHSTSAQTSSLHHHCDVHPDHGNGLLQTLNLVDDVRQCQEASVSREDGPAPVATTGSAGTAVMLAPGSPALEKDLRKGGADERICRICHSSVSKELEMDCNEVNIELGCACKNDLALAHRQCAEEWFKIKGDRTCEICGCVVKNLLYRGEEASLAQCSDASSIHVTVSAPGRVPSDGATLCWFQQPLINFLIACTIIIFIIPWIFRTIMFT